MRRPVKKRPQVEPEYRYQSQKLAKFINYIMLDGKKHTARRVVYMALEDIKKEAGVEDPMEVFYAAVHNASPVMEVRSRRVGGASYQVPREVRPERRQTLAMKWIIAAARSRKGSPMYKNLSSELIQASNNEGEAVTKKENTHKMAEANKAFAHFAW
ncbi:MAG: 30S ribosomal protein S7 [Candidatus Paceibacterota bacterium]